MKKSVMKFPAKILMPVMVFGVFITACNNNDTTPTRVYPADSLEVEKGDPMTMDPAHTMQADTSGSSMMSGSDSLSKVQGDTAMKSNMDKKGKKGKVTIMPADTKASTAAMEMDKDGFYSNTEVLPSFPGGEKALERFFESNLQYPEIATENGTEGTVNLAFNVDENGKIYQPVATGEKIGNGLEEEAIRVFNKMPKWTPGKIKGKNVKTRFTLPIKFQLY